MNPMQTDFSQLDLSRVPSPSFVVDELALEKNLRCLHEVQEQSGAKILHALKAFSMHSLAHLTGQYLSGCCASGINEALLAQEYYGGEVHVFSPAFSEKELNHLLQFAHHIVFNSCSQWLRYYKKCEQAKKNRPELHFGLRINPEHSEGEFEIYDPCAEGSRLGITLAQLERFFQQSEFQESFELISGFHFHTLCEQGFEPLERTLMAFEKKFQKYLPALQWVNFGGGHHITRAEYRREDLVKCIRDFSQKYQLQIYLEPGEALAIGTGVLVAEVVDLGFNEVQQAILNTSATCHMPDVLEMPYRPVVQGAGEAGMKAYTYRLGGLTCLAGDVIGDYSFDEPLKIGDKLIFEDMSHYTMVKTSTFNGMNLPAIVVWNSESDSVRVVREFDYQDFKQRLS